MNLPTKEQLEEILSIPNDNVNNKIHRLAGATFLLAWLVENN